MLGGADFLAPSDRLTKADIGVGCMGPNYFPYDGTQVVAIWDVDNRHLAQALTMLLAGSKPLAVTAN